MDKCNQIVYAILLNFVFNVRRIYRHNNLLFLLIYFMRIAFRPIETSTDINIDVLKAICAIFHFKQSLFLKINNLFQMNNTS